MTFKCRKCGHCCKNGIIVLYPEDIEYISNYLKLTKTEFVHTYCSRKNINICESIDLPIYYLDISYGCIFLSEDNLCNIHLVKPLQCKYGPQKYFNSINTWKNCKHLMKLDSNPFAGKELPDEYFVKKILDGYNLE